MDYGRVLRNSYVLCTVMILVCCSIVVANGTFHHDAADGVRGGDIQGKWIETQSYSIINGIKMNSVSSENDILIDSYGDHYAKCHYRGTDYIAVRIGDSLFWDFSSAGGKSYAEVNIYTDCLVVSEIYEGSGGNEKLIVSSNLYTRDGHTPSWFDYYVGDLKNLKWDLSSANKMDSRGVSGLQGKNLYFTSFYGPVFTAEMEQDDDGEIVTAKLTGTLLGLDEGGAFSALAMDSNQSMWYMFYNGSVMSLESVMPDSTLFGSGITCVERNYEELSDSSSPDYSEGAIELGSVWTIELARKISDDGISDIPTAGEYKVTMTKDQLFTMSTNTDHPIVSFIGFTMPTMSNPGQHMVGFGSLSSFFHFASSAYGIYDSHTQVLHLVMFTQDSSGNNIAVEYYMHKRSD